MGAYKSFDCYNCINCIPCPECIVKKWMFGDYSHLPIVIGRTSLGLLVELYQLLHCLKPEIILNVVLV